MEFTYLTLNNNDIKHLKNLRYNLSARYRKSQNTTERTLSDNADILSIINSFDAPAYGGLLKI
jgi:hypothetical protein